MEPVPHVYDILVTNLDKLRQLKKNQGTNSKFIALNSACNEFDSFGDSVDKQKLTFYSINASRILEESRRNPPHWMLYELGSFNKNHLLKHFEATWVKQQLGYPLKYFHQDINDTSKYTERFI